MLALPVYARCGIFYIHTRLPNGQQFKKSLKTRDKATAMILAIRLLELIRQGHMIDWDNIRKLEISAGGFTAKIENDNDLNMFQKLLDNQNFRQVLSTPSPQPKKPSVAPENLTGTSIKEVADRYQTRHEKIKAAKTLYEYGNYHKHFLNWVAKRKQANPYPIRLITNEDMAAYIDDLLSEGKTPQAIQTKYLGAINALFEFAKTIGAYPKEQIVPSRGHKLFNKAKHKANRKPFSLDDLKTIFDPANLLTKTRHPEEFWLPILGLFTGGRISELSQLTINDIKQQDSIWTISINEEEDKIVKTTAGIRTIPIHPQVIELGFLDYVNDVQQFNGRLFPELTPDQFGHYGKQPSTRFGTYMDKIGLPEKSKVFHSFRSTANNHLKQAGVPEETRCQFIGHEHETTNSATYAEPHSIRYLLENVASKLVFGIDFSGLKYQPKKYNAFISRELIKQERKKNHLAAKAKRQQ